MALTNVSIPVSAAPVVEPNSFVATIPWFNFFSLLSTQLNAAITVINGVPGVNVFALAGQPTLGAGDAGYLGFVSDYSHWVRWTGAIWMRLDDAPGIFVDCAADPGVGYAPCNGVATTLLVFGGAALTTSAFTPPDVVGTPAYKKSIAAYIGTINAKAGSTGTGSTGTGSTGTGTTGTGTTGSSTDTFTTSTGDTSTPPAGTVAAGTNISLATHVHTGTTNGHTHTVPGLSVPALSVPSLSVPALAVGSIEMANLGVLMYVRR